MKIRKLSPDNYTKATALLRQAFPGSSYEVRLFENLHKNEKTIHEWVCIHSTKITAYIAFTQAFEGSQVCGLHLSPLAVKPQFQNQGIGSELLRFSLRQEIIKANSIFVLGDPNFYKRFGFEHCKYPICPFDKNNAHFLCINNAASHKYTVGYEQEFELGS